MTTLTAPTILVIVGITGDLARRKLLPAVEAIARAGVLPSHFAIVGITRQKNIKIEDLSANMKDVSFLRRHLELFAMDSSGAQEYGRLGAHLLKIEKRFGAPAQRLFYLSVPPRASQPIIEMLGTSGLANVPGAKLLLEKPFGIDLASATHLVEKISAHFAPEQVYRIDHYLAKEMAQNLIVFREYNSLFRRTWNKDFIERIEILASEEIGIEGRVDFYEQTGALRDIVQSHLLQLAALTLMAPETESHEDVPLRRLKALRSLRIPSNKSLRSYVQRGQYKGYREEVRNPGSKVETFVSMTLHSSDPRFDSIPITLVTGKKLDAKATEIRIFYKKDNDREANGLTLHLQPHEGVSMNVWSKRPGYEREIERRIFDFTYATPDEELPDAYEQVLFDTMRSDHALFLSSEEVLESWRIITPLQEAWGKSAADLRIYEGGSNPTDIRTTFLS
jgi:glucose-6-phosphate 1-dehydrogenase